MNSSKKKQIQLMLDRQKVINQKQRKMRHINAAQAEVVTKSSHGFIPPAMYW